MTPAELEAENELLRAEREQANREDAPFLALQWAEAALAEQGFLAERDELLSIERTSGGQIVAVAWRTIVGQPALSTRLDVQPRVLSHQPRKPGISDLRADPSPTGEPAQLSDQDSYELVDRETGSVVTVRVSRDRTHVEVLAQAVPDVPRIFLEVGEVVVEMPVKPGCPGSFEITIDEDSDLASDLISVLENPEATTTLHLPKVSMSEEQERA